MPIEAYLRYLRIAPRKVRLVADLIRGKKVLEAQNILNFTTKRAAPILLKLLKSAISNAKHNFGLEKPNLYISEIRVDEGPKLKRWIPKARGQISEIQKKTSHVTLILDEIEKRPRKIEKIEKLEGKEKIPKVEKPKIRPEIEIKKPKFERGLRKIFRRKAF